MNSKKIILPAFILIVLLQLFIPAKMIFDREDVLNKGTEYKFKTAPIDPNDPFRGKYITLQYNENQIQIQDEKNWVSGETIYVLFSKDSVGFAKIKSVVKKKPNGFHDFLKAEIDYVTSNGSNKLTIKYPFDRFYLEESKANETERIYMNSLSDSMQLTYALINIKDGDAVIKDVMINGKSIKELVMQNQPIDH